VTLTFRYLDPAAESQALVASGFEVVARLDRTSGPGEHASERTLKRPRFSAALIRVAALG